MTDQPEQARHQLLGCLETVRADLASAEQHSSSVVAAQAARLIEQQTAKLAELEQQAAWRDAAPKLLRAARFALESLDAIDVPQEWDCRELLRTAIAKATGAAPEKEPSECPTCKGDGEGQTDGSYSDIPLCPTCKGSGRAVEIQGNQ